MINYKFWFKDFSDLKKSFYLLLLILFILPIPLGSNRPWAWNLIQIAIFSLSIYVNFQYRKNVMLGMEKYVSMVFLWLLFLILACIQIIPLPHFLLEILSSKSYEAYMIVDAKYAYISLDTGQSKIGIIKLLSFICLSTLIFQLVTTEERIKTLLVTMVASGTFQAVYGALEVLLGGQKSLIFGLDVTNVATGSFVYKNHYANFLMLCLCAGMGLLVTSIEKEKHHSPRDFIRKFANALLSSKGIIRISLAIMVIALVMTRSRMGNTAFFVSMAVTCVLAILLIKNRSRGLLILTVSVFIIDLLIVSTYFGLERVKERLVQTNLEKESRDEVLIEATKIIQDFPLFGSGGGSFYSVFPWYQKSSVAGFYDHAHNEYLQFAIEYGLFGLFILATILIFSFFKALRAMKKRRNSIFKGTGFACSMAIIGMSIHISVDFPLQAYANACYFIVFISLAMISNGIKIRRVSHTQNSD